ncbi:hypothetical protein BGX26_004564, partial [Mortierella sp. AD094]
QIMNEKDIDGSVRACTIKYDDIIMSPPPSYASSTLNSSDNRDPLSSTQQQQAVESYYRAYPVGCTSGGGGRRIRQNSNTNAPFTDIYLAPPGVVSDTNNPSVVVYVLDEVKDDDAKRCAGIPMAMMCFIFG